MPISRVTEESITVVCSNCAVARDVQRADLVLGTKRDPNMICAPPCACGSVEIFVRTWDTCPSQFTGSRFDVHRRVVNSLAQCIKAAGRSHASHAPTHVGETTAPPDLFSGDLDAAVVPLPAELAARVA